MKKRTPKKHPVPSVGRSRVQDLADIITANRSRRSALETHEVELQMKLNKARKAVSDVDRALVAAYREMDKQVAGPVLNR